MAAEYQIEHVRGDGVAENVEYGYGDGVERFTMHCERFPALTLRLTVFGTGAKKKDVKKRPSDIVQPAAVTGFHSFTSASGGSAGTDLFAMPRLINTHGSEDGAIQNAIDADDHVANLVAIIERLDGVIDAWKKAADKAGCDDPESLSRFIDGLESN